MVFLFYISNILFSVSCKDIAISKGPITGEYLIYSRTKQNQSYNVFCEFHQTYGLTFVSNTNATIDANELFEIKFQVVVRHLRNNKQYDSILEQITPYADKPLTVKYNSFAGFRAPLNAKKMGPYLYLGFLYKDTAKAKTCRDTGSMMPIKRLSTVIGIQTVILPFISTLKATFLVDITKGVVTRR